MHLHARLLEPLVTVIRSPTSPQATANTLALIIIIRGRRSGRQHPLNSLADIPHARSRTPHAFSDAIHRIVIGVVASPHVTRSHTHRARRSCVKQPGPPTRAILHRVSSTQACTSTHACARLVDTSEEGVRSLGRPPTGRVSCTARMWVAHSCIVPPRSQPHSARIVLLAISAPNA